MDNLTPADRRKTMAAIRSQNTRPERVVRYALRRLKIRFRRSLALPGSPDFVLTEYRAALFVHGCYWHGHGCRRNLKPATNREYWQKKFSSNHRRDRRVRRQLNRDGWTVLVVWECQLKSGLTAERVIRRAVGRAARQSAVGQQYLTSKRSRKRTSPPRRGPIIQ